MVVPFPYKTGQCRFGILGRFKTLDRERMYFPASGEEERIVEEELVGIFRGAGIKEHQRPSGIRPFTAGAGGNVCHHIFRIALRSVQLYQVRHVAEAGIRIVVAAAGIQNPVL